MDDVGGSHAQYRTQRPADHGSRRQGGDGVEARRRRRLQQRHHDQRIAGRPGDRVGGHQRRQRPGQPRRRPHLEERRQESAGRARRDSRVARRGVAVRRRHGLRHLRRPPDRRSQALRVRHEGLRRDLDVDRVEPADGQRQRDHDGQPQPQPALPRHRVRDLRVAGCRHVVETVDAGPADRAHRRPDHPSARARPDCGHARPEHLDPRRHLAARADDRPDHDRRRDIVRRPCGDDLDERHPEADHGGRPESLPRAEPGSGHGDQLLAEGRRRQRARRHLRRHRPRRPDDRGPEDGRAQPRALEPAGQSTAGARRPGRRRRTGGAARRDRGGVAAGRVQSAGDAAGRGPAGGGT